MKIHERYIDMVISAIIAAIIAAIFNIITYNFGSIHLVCGRAGKPRNSAGFTKSTVPYPFAFW